MDATLIALLVGGLCIAASAGAQTTSCHGEVYDCFMLRVSAADDAAVMASQGLTFEEDIRHGS